MGTTNHKFKPVAEHLEFRPAHYARQQVERLTLTQMDELLANGHYRTGLDICAHSIRMMKMDWVPSVMLRVRLDDFEWKKRLRKLMRINDLKFQTEFRPFQPTPDMEALWQRYKLGVHGWRNVPTLAQHILRGKTADDFNTWQLSVFAEGKLVAFSAFDRGLRSIASLEAAYDPEFHRNSLGIYTMLLEIAWCQAHGLDFYYPGFFPKDDPMFDYKLRPGNVEYFQVDSGEWRPIETVGAADWKLDELWLRIGALQSELDAAAIPFSPGFSHCLHLPSDEPALQDSNLQIIVPVRAIAVRPLLLFVHWDFGRNTYHVFEGQNISPSLNPDLVGPNRPHHFHTVQTGNYFGSFKTPAEVRLLAQRLKLGIISPAS